jgi:phenylacetate-coenzyme A ligase PaaK-like adenylate-forming protein
MLITRLFWNTYLAYHMVGQSRLPFKPLETIKRIQSQRVRKMVAHAYRTVPYYRETMDRLGLRIEDFQNAEDLAKLPLIDPSELQHHPEYFISTAQPTERYVHLHTGGSTGDPRSVYHTPRAVFQNAAHGERERGIFVSRIGKPFGYRETVIASPNCTAHKLQAFCQSRGLFPARFRINRQYISLMDPTEENVRLINHFQPDVIQSYGSYLAILFSYLADTGVSFHRPKVISFSSDGLADSVRRLIQEQFGIPVFSSYQANEALKLGFECESHLGFHLNVDLYPVRVIDAAGRDLPTGEVGEVVVSNLVNRATVLLNYRLGDLASFLPEACPCGRSLPMLSFTPGRSDDLITLPSGRLIHPQAVRTIFTVERQVWQYQIVQHSTTRFSVKIVASKEADRQELKERVAAGFAERFGSEVSADISFVESIDRTAGGKARPVISMTQKSLSGLAEKRGN